MNKTHDEATRARACTHGPRVLALALAAVCAGACTGGNAPADAGADAADAQTAADVPRDAFVRTAPPACPADPPFAPPACGTGAPRRGILALDAALDAKARRFDRGFRAVHSVYTGVNAEVRAVDEAAREALDRFVREGDGWDLTVAAGARPEALVRWDKVAGAYAGAGAAADAFRYAVLRDEGAACDEVAVALAQLHAAMDGMHRAVALAGAPGVIARGYVRRDLPGGEVYPTTPLFDAAGNPLPAVKTNGTWREPAPGAPADYVWEDSCSRDMLVGWVMGMAAAWEVSRNDPAVDPARVAALRADAAAIAATLRERTPAGYDLEIHDADGRTTYHGYLHESAIDRTYLRGSRGNGQHAVMALGIVAALARVSGDEATADWLHNDLIRLRDLPGIVRTGADVFEAGAMTNFSNYNMAFTGAWLAGRYLCDEGALASVREGITERLYATPGAPRQPAEMGQSFFDMVAIAARGGATAWRGVDPAALDAGALARATQTLREFPDAPYWELPRTNCDDAEVAANNCVGDDGTPLPLTGTTNRADEVIAVAPVPMRIRPASNFFWRSDPYRPNGAGDRMRLLPGVDFRMAYWIGRHLQAR